MLILLGWEVNNEMYIKPYEEINPRITFNLMQALYYDMKKDVQ